MTVYLNQLHPQALTTAERKLRTDKINENYALLYNDIATCLFSQKDYSDAAKLFHEARKFKIDDIGILSNIGDCALVRVVEIIVETWICGRGYHLV
jgi:pentatricopeptide repeat protein